MQTNFSTEQQFIQTIALSAQKACKRYGYLPSVLIAQACLENGYGIPSNWDNSEIKYLLKYNNMIGQKTELLTSTWYDKSVWPGKSFNKNTPEYYSENTKTIIKDSFRVFDNIQQSFCDFILFLLYASNIGYNQRPKYGKEVVNIKNPEKLIQQVSNRGYATGPTYSKSVMNIINKHNLIKYDNLSKIEGSKYIPDAIRNQYQDIGEKIMNIQPKNIHDITQTNLSQVPETRGNSKIQWIVIHYLGVPNADNPYLYGGGYGGHYNIQRNGEIFKAADPKTAVVWHCGGGLQGTQGHQYYKICTNYNSIGIENGVCYDGTWYFTEETQESLVFLVSTLMDEYNIDINHVIRHFDVTGKKCPAPYVNNDKYKTSWTWDEFKAILQKYREQKHQSTEYPIPPFLVHVKIDDLNIRQGPDEKYPSNGYTGINTFTITEVSGDWGKLKSEQGWIYIKNPNYCTIEKFYTYQGLEYNLVFNPVYYAEHNDDLKDAYGNDDEKLFKHFCDYGMKQGRQAISTFNVKKYKNNYEDLRAVFGSNLPLYYQHYIEYGYNEHRQAI